MSASACTLVWLQYPIIKAALKCIEFEKIAWEICQVRGIKGGVSEKVRMFSWLFWPCLQLHREGEVFRFGGLLALEVSAMMQHPKCKMACKEYCGNME